jgi:hypothetical protein
MRLSVQTRLYHAHHDELIFFMTACSYFQTSADTTKYGWFTPESGPATVARPLAMAPLLSSPMNLSQEAEDEDVRLFPE